MTILVVLGLIGLVAAVGAASKEARKPLHRRWVMVNGAATLAKGARVAWRKPGVVLDRVAVSYLVCVAVFAGVIFTFRPDLVWPAVAAAVVYVCVGFVCWDQRLTGGRQWREFLADVMRADSVRQAIVATNPDAKPGAVNVRAGRVEAAVEYVGSLDHERVGQALHTPHVELVPGAQMGRAMVLVHDARPAPERPVWESLAVVHRWPGPSSTDPNAPIPVAVDVHSQVVTIAVPGEGGKHLLVAGSTGAGKSVFLSVVLAELCFRDVELWLADPKMVEFRAFKDRARVAAGIDATGAMLDDAYDEMMARYTSMEGRQWTGRKLILVIDELAAVTTGGRATGAGGRIQKLGLILAMGRAAGVGLVLCTQRPSKDVIPLDLRDNTRVRVALGCESEYQTDMILGSQTKWPVHEIPESLPGTAYVRVDRSATLCRSFLLTDADIDHVAAATAYLKGA